MTGRKFGHGLMWALIAVLMPGRVSAQQTKPNASEPLWVLGGGLRLKTRFYESAKRSAHPRMIIILHGDSPFGPPSYQYAFAKRAAEQLDDVVAVAILRPGYTDDAGDQSDGVRGETTGDNYTPAVVDALAEAIGELKLTFHPSATVLVGHSGGAAIAADLLGRHSESAAGALLVSCPCDVVAWRLHMFEMQGGAIWKQPVESLSPIELAGEVPAAKHVRLVVGAEDPVAPPRFTQAYADAMTKHGVPVQMRVEAGLKHDILLEPVVEVELKALLQSLPRK